MSHMLAGAKSIFQVASCVWISSRDFAFMLDRNAELGMMSPQWASDFEERRGWTTMRLDFCDGNQFGIVKTQLEQVRDTILLFMRRLVHLSIDDGTGTFSAVRRRSSGGDDVAIYRTSSIEPPNCWRFLRVSQSIAAYPSEPKRLRTGTTEIELCFPLNELGQPYLAWQQVYAFLPLRPVGLKLSQSVDLSTLRLTRHCSFSSRRTF